MPEGTITYGAKVTEVNIHDIVRNAAHWKLSVSAEVEDAVEEAAEYDETIYAILSVNWDLRYATFITMWSEDFNNTWRFAGDQIHGSSFRSIELINPRTR